MNFGDEDNMSAQNNCLYLSSYNNFIFPGAMTEFLKANISFVTSVCTSAWIEFYSTARIFIKFHFCGFFRTLSRKFKLNYNLARITGTLHEDLCTGLRHINTFRSTTDRIYDGGPIVL